MLLRPEVPAGGGKLISIPVKSNGPVLVTVEVVTVLAVVEEVAVFVGWLNVPVTDTRQDVMTIGRATINPITRQ